MKVKLRHEGVFVVGGIRNLDAFDGVLVGQRVDGELRYRGVVECGFRAADVLELLREAYAAARVPPYVNPPPRTRSEPVSRRRGAALGSA